MPLKNNKEREEYIRDEHNWIEPDFDLRNPKLKVKHLKGTDIYRIYLMSVPLYERGNPHWVEIACKRFNEEGNMLCIYDLSINQLIDYLRKNKI